MKRVLVMIGICWGILGGSRGVMDVLAAPSETTAQTEAFSETEGAPEITEPLSGAEENVTSLSQIMSVNRSVDMKARPEAGAETLMTYETGALIFVTGETADGWYQVLYQDKVGYVDKNALQMQEMDVEGLDAEMSVNEEEGKLVLETVEKYNMEAKQSKIWGGVIILLVVAIFAVGIISAVKSRQEEEPRKPYQKKIKVEDWNN